MKLENWSFVVSIGDPYKAPEQWRRALAGEVHGNPNFENGKRIITSNVTEFDPERLTARTESGSVYVLGQIDPGFADYLATKGHILEDYKK